MATAFTMYFRGGDFILLVGKPLDKDVKYLCIVLAKGHHFLGAFFEFGCKGRAEERRNLAQEVLVNLEFILSVTHVQRYGRNIAEPTSL